MQIRYTRHALRRMAQRKIAKEDVELTLDVPDEVVHGDLDELIAIRRFGSREVRVVYGIQLAWDLDEQEVLVIYTVMKPKIR